MDISQQQALLKFRESQVIPGKFFSNGKFDSDLVAKILAVTELKQKLLRCLQSSDLVGVRELFEDGTLKDWSGLPASRLANVVFDAGFSTPLHVAVEAGCAEIVAYLVFAGAQPRRDFSGRLPWERFFIGPY